MLFRRAHPCAAATHEDSGGDLDRRRLIGHGLSVSGRPRPIIPGIEPAEASELYGEGFDVPITSAAK
jgi:hypothetical protein